jgi:hypothetical protein
MTFVLVWDIYAFFYPNNSMDYVGLCTNHRKQHFESHAGVDRMWYISRHDDDLALRNLLLFASDG